MSTMKEPQTVVARYFLQISLSLSPSLFETYIFLQTKIKIVKLAYFICLCVHALYCDFQFHCEYFNKQLSFLSHSQHDSSHSLLLSFLSLKLSSNNFSELHISCMNIVCMCYIVCISGLWWDVKLKIQVKDRANKNKNLKSS